MLVISESQIGSFTIRKEALNPKKNRQENENLNKTDNENPKDEINSPSKEMVNTIKTYF